MSRFLRAHLSYANIMATAAVFIALGGTSYALTLPRNSVGSTQLRPDSVGRSELRNGAVRSANIGDRAIRLRDISQSTRGALRGPSGPAGPQGPAGVEFRASVNSAGTYAAGNADSSSGGSLGVRIIGFTRSVADCVATATLTSLPGGPNPDPPPLAHIAVSHNGDGRVLVRTWDPAGTPTNYPFNLTVAC